MQCILCTMLLVGRGCSRVGLGRGLELLLEVRGNEMFSIFIRSSSYSTCTVQRELVFSYLCRSNIEWNNHNLSRSCTLVFHTMFYLCLDDGPIGKFCIQIVCARLGIDCLDNRCMFRYYYRICPNHSCCMPLVLFELPWFLRRRIVCIGSNLHPLKTDTNR